MKNDLKYKTDIYRFNEKKNCWSKYKDYDLIYTFKFGGCEFCLTYKDGIYYACAYFDDQDDRLYSIYVQKEIANGEKCMPGEVVSEFRKKYLKNSITTDKIEKFILDPMKYGIKKSVS